MAEISVTDQEVEDWQHQIEDIVGWFDQLQAVDVSGVEPAAIADGKEQGSLRPDVPRAYENRDAIMESVPNKERSYVKVPKIM
ncbi:hypothetical protein WJX73_008064 [Symbiochloris irregularis]|uniref:Glu-AdT subunit C n=1 Tax=Symbiochloris irregularis TaxID=706552 RepID=A0AAW1Q0D1_9CHLO